IVIWEYASDAGWARLEPDDETASFARRGVLEFIGPPDFSASVEFNTRAFWLRARWSGGGYTSPPRLRRVLLNTTWASHTATIPLEVLGSGNGEPNQLLRTTRAPVLLGQRLEVREAELPPTDEHVAILDEEGPDAITLATDPTTGAAVIWIRWHPVSNFNRSDPRSRHYALDWLTGEGRFGD